MSKLWLGGVSCCVAHVIYEPLLIYYYFCFSPPDFSRYIVLGYVGVRRSHIFDTKLTKHTSVCVPYFAGVCWRRPQTFMVHIFKQRRCFDLCAAQVPKTRQRLQQLPTVVSGYCIFCYKLRYLKPIIRIQMFEYFRGPFCRHVLGYLEPVGWETGSFRN